MSNEYMLLYGVYRDVYTWISFIGFIIKESDGTFKGHIVDAYGNTRIEGSINDNHLQFSKIYDEGRNIGVVYTTRDPIKYELELISNGRWEGLFTLASNRTGTVKCVLEKYIPTSRDKQDAEFAKLMLSLN